MTVRCVLPLLSVARNVRRVGRRKRIVIPSHAPLIVNGVIGVHGAHAAILVGVV
jgi:hypothetical protein